jgi:hypothetical protein
MNSKSNYLAAVKYLNHNYEKIFLPDIKANAISINRYYLNKFDSCLSLRVLFDREPIEYVLAGRDSTIYFYSKSFEGGGLRTKQSILLYLPKGTIKDLDLTTDLRVISKVDTSWYQLERITSIAD